MDILSRVYDSYFGWAERLVPAHFNGLLRLLLSFGLPAMLTATVFERGNRSVFLQMICCTVGLLLAATLPVEKLALHNRIVRGWLIALAVVALCFLPSILAFVLVPQLGLQRKMRWGLYILMAGLVTAILVPKGGGP